MKTFQDSAPLFVQGNLEGLFLFVSFPFKTNLYTPCVSFTEQRKNFTERL